MYSGKSRLKKNERINFLSSEVKFHSTEERKIERRRICFLKLKERRSSKKRINYAWTAQLTNTRRDISFQYIHTSLSHTHSYIPITPYSNFTNTEENTLTPTIFTVSPPLHLIFKPRDREYHLSNSSSKREWRWAVKAISKGWNTRLILSRIYGTA